MTLLNPIALLFSLLAGAIVLMYLLKLRRKREVFSSTLLWRRAVEDLIANAPFQKLRQNLLMYLQILLLILVAFALARPTMWLRRLHGASYILMIDNTASMNAADGPGGATRLEAARATALRLVGNLRPGDQAMIVTFGGRARVLQPSTSEKATLRRAIEAIEPTDAGSAIREALQLAKSVRRIDENAVLTVIGDGGVGYLGNLIGEKDQVDFIGVGASNDNRAIVAFDVRESFERRGQLQAFAEVQNFSDRPAETLVRCLIDGQVAQVKEAKLGPKGKQGFVFTGLEGGGGSERLLRIELSAPDLLAADNAVQGLVSLGAGTRILLVTQGNFFLERMLALLPGARVQKVAPGAWQPGGDFDFVIFDQWAPAQIGPGRYLFLAAAPPLPGFKRAEKPLKNQIIMDWNRLHPITRFVSFEDLGVAESLDITPADWTVALAESSMSPLIVAGDYQGIRLVSVAFDIYNTDWPLQPSFPIFFSNAANWLAGGARGGLAAIQHATGSTIQLPAAPGLEVRGPGGRTWHPGGQSMVYFNETLRAGLYEVRAGSPPGPPQRLAVNLLSLQESDIAPKREIIAGEKKIVAAKAGRENREIWSWFVIAALGLALVEWHIYCRRSWL